MLKIVIANKPERREVGISIGCKNKNIKSLLSNKNPRT